MITACFFGIVLSFSIVLLKNLGWRGAPVFGALGFVLIIAEAGDILADVTKLSFVWEPLGDAASAIFKIIGIGYLFGVSSEICRELGEGGIASSLVLLGRLEAIAVALPYIAEIFSLAISLVE